MTERHCERSEAIQIGPVPCWIIATTVQTDRLAMTDNEESETCP